MDSFGVLLQVSERLSRPNVNPGAEGQETTPWTYDGIGRVLEEDYADPGCGTGGNQAESEYHYDDMFPGEVRPLSGSYCTILVGRLTRVRYKVWCDIALSGDTFGQHLWYGYDEVGRVLQTLMSDEWSGPTGSHKHFYVYDADSSAILYTHSSGAQAYYYTGASGATGATAEVSNDSILSKSRTLATHSSTTSNTILSALSPAIPR